MKLFLVNIWKYLTVFFAGVITALVWVQSRIKPQQTNVNGTYIEKQDQHIGKLKQRGEGNRQEAWRQETGDGEQDKSRKELRKEKREKRKAKRKQMDSKV